MFQNQDDGTCCSSQADFIHPGQPAEAPAGGGEDDGHCHHLQRQGDHCSSLFGSGITLDVGLLDQGLTVEGGRVGDHNGQILKNRG